jgi:4'-phosphopantetheinyl transferase
MRDEGLGTGDEGNGIAVATWSLCEPVEVVDSLFTLLSEDERKRVATFVRDEPRRRFIVTRGRLRERLGERLGVAPMMVVFNYGPNGKPEVEGVHFNVAHTGDLALCAFADAPVGVDVERIRPMKDAQGLARRWFRAEEVERIDAAHDPLTEFFRTWTMKEAALKLIGVGVGESLPKVLTPAEGVGGWATGLPANSLGIDRCRVDPVAIDYEHVAALAFSPTPDSV